MSRRSSSGVLIYVTDTRACTLVRATDPPNIRTTHWCRHRCGTAPVCVCVGGSYRLSHTHTHTRSHIDYTSGSDGKHDTRLYRQFLRVRRIRVWAL